MKRVILSENQPIMASHLYVRDDFLKKKAIK